MLLTVTIMTFWWQILFKRNLENYIPARLFAIEQEEKEILSKGLTLKPNPKIFETVQNCQALLCFEHKGRLYQIKSSVYLGLLQEKKKQERIFFYESLFLILVLIGSALYLVFLIHRERQDYQEREEFLALATHELKHPISSVLLILESLKRGALNKKQQKNFIDKALKEMVLLQKEIEGLLKLQEFSVYLVKAEKRYSLKNLLLKVVSQLEEEYSGKNRIVIEGADVFLFNVNENGLEIILRNILENALLYSRDKVMVKIFKKGKEVVIQIADSGVGFSKEEKKKAGKMFYRSPRLEVQKVKGRGLGLFIVFYLAKKMHLKVLLQSQGVNQGSIFLVRIKNP